MRAINASVMRRINKKLILNQIRIRPISRAELAEETHLTRASITQIVDELIVEGLVEETNVVGRMRLGRKSTQLEIAPSAGAMFGICLYPDSCLIGAVDMKGNPIGEEIQLEGRYAPEEALSNIAKAMEAQKQGLSRCFGAGVCVPGPVNAEEGRLLEPIGFEAWHNLPLVRELSARIGVPVFLESTVNSCALEEKFFGSAAEHFALIQVGEGVSAAIVSNGKIYHGTHCRAADLGALAVGADPNQGRIEEKMLLSGTRWRGLNDLILNWQDLEAAEPMDRFMRYLALGAVNLSRAFDVSHFVIACEPLLRNEHLLNVLRDRIESHDEKDWILRFGVTSNPVRMAASTAFEAFYSPEIED